MSQSNNSSECSSTNNSIKIEYHHGPRNSRQILYQNNLYGYFRGNSWKCIHKKCTASIVVDISLDTITDTSKGTHLGHMDRSPCEIDCRQANEQMKLEITREPTVDPKDIYDRNVTTVLKKGYTISDIHNFIPAYQKFRGTLNKIKEKERPSLPKSLRDIDFRLPLYQQ
jgi:hypothetical protein